MRVMETLRHEKGLVGWAARWWRALLAEVLSTALLVGLGCAAMVPLGGPGSAPLTHPALAFGFLVAGNVCAFGAVSGAHMNPAVSLAAVLCGQLAVLPALAYVVAQCVGATLGIAALLAVTPDDHKLHAIGTTAPGPGVTPLGALLFEMVLTGMLVLALCGEWAAHEPACPDRTVGIKLGLVVVAVIYAGGPATGAGINPARSFGPAVMQGAWDYHWVYWVGPLLGSALAALLQRWVLSPRSPRSESAEPRDVELPLND